METFDLTLKITPVAPEQFTVKIGDAILSYNGFELEFFDYDPRAKMPKLKACVIMQLPRALKILRSFLRLDEPGKAFRKFCPDY